MQLRALASSARLLISLRYNMTARLVVMTADGKDFGYFSNQYGLVRQDCPEISSFLDEKIPTEKHLERIHRAHQRAIKYIEKELAGSVRRHQQYGNYQCQVAHFETKLEQEKNIEWVIARLHSTVVLSAKNNP